MTTKWSGLGPAVDAHLAKWYEADRCFVDAEKTLHHKHPQAAERFLRTAWGLRWATFGASYGLPDPDGVPHVVTGVQEGQTIVGREQFHADEAAIGQGAHLAVREHRMLSKAVSHYVSGEVCTEVTLSADMAEPEPLYDTDLFTPFGFAVFEHPIVFPDLDPQSGFPHPTLEVHMRAIGWAREDAIFSSRDEAFHSGVSIFFYTSREDYANGYYATGQKAGIDLPPPEDISGGLIPIEVIPWSFGMNWTTRDTVGYEPGTVPHPVAAQRRWFLSFMRLCWQQIIVRHATHEPRQTQRRWERMAKRKELLDYTVLRLRREVDPTYQGTGLGVPLDHRVLVRAHWRRVHVRSLGPARLADGSMDPLTHRLVWIEAHFRGPADGPLGALHSATSVIR